MTGLWGLALTLAAGGLGGWAAHALRLPGGAVLGSLIAAGALHIALPALVPVPDAVRITAQILVGTAVGTTLSRDPLRALLRVTASALPLLCLLLAMGVLGGFLFARVSDLSLVTTLFSTAPGGASDMAAAALEFDTDVALIAGFHMIRQIAVFSLLTWIFTRWFGNSPPKSGKG